MKLKIKCGFFTPPDGESKIFYSVKIGFFFFTPPARESRNFYSVKIGFKLLVKNKTCRKSESYSNV